jgi:myo-inositol-1(or 4)-monophosphatase
LADVNSRDRNDLLARDATLLENAVREAGALALSLFRTELKNWIKGASSPVSEADIAVNDLLEARLRSATPEYGWLSEESADDETRLAKQLVWIVDPIDGTRAYVAGRTDWAVSVALVEDGRPVAAAVFAPMEDGFYLALAGEGATRDGLAVAASEAAHFDHARVAGPQRRIERLAASEPNIIAEPKVHSLALRIARVATGQLDVAFAGPDSHDWDLAAADLLVHEAGGVLTTLDGQPLTYNRADATHGALIAAGRARHGRLIDIMRDPRP